jgi:hypothetical protein
MLCTGKVNEQRFYVLSRVNNQEAMRWADLLNQGAMYGDEPRYYLLGREKNEPRRFVPGRVK